MATVRKKRRTTSNEPRRYEFRNAARELLEYQGKEVVACGCAGSGKTISAAFKLHYCCEAVPGIRCLMVRKTRTSLTESAMVTFENKILPENHYCIRQGGTRKMRQSYRYANGSEIVLGGMDKPEKILSTEYDLIFVNEAIQLTEDDWEVLITRLRHNKMPYQQIFGDTNPGAPGHWLRKRSLGENPRLKMITSTLEDNPAYYDDKRKRFTPIGLKYVENLDSLTGAMHKRMRYGLWVQAEGVVYPTFNNEIHVIQPQDLPGGGPYPPPHWPRYWGVDFGAVDPFVAHFYALDDDKKLYLYREIYKTHTLIQDHATRMLAMWREEAEFWGRKRSVPMETAMRQLTPRAIITDTQRSERMTLEKHLGMATTGARKNIMRGIQAVSDRLRLGPDRKPALYFVSDMLDATDQDLAERKQPCSVLDEMSAYCWEPDKDKPIDKWNHGADVMAYVVTQLDIGISGLWEVAEPVTPGGERIGGSGIFSHNSAVHPQPGLRYGADGRTTSARRSKGSSRLFGRGGSYHG